MKVVMVAAFLQLLRSAASGQSSNKTVVYGSLGEDLLLQCSDSDGSPVYSARWTKDGREITKRDVSAATAASESTSPPPGQHPHHHQDHHHTIIMDNGTLCIHGLTVADEGTYLCNASLNNSTATAQTPVQLRVVSGPSNISAWIGPAAALANGTLYVKRGATVSFSCSAAWQPSQSLTWSFRGGSSSNDSLATATGAPGGGSSSSSSSLDFRIEDVQPEAQGEYSCTARDSLSQGNASWSTQLLVYYTPERHPQCRWKLGEDPAQVHFICSWLGAYPAPTLRWGENHHVSPGLDTGHLYVSEQNHSVALVLNRTSLFDGMALKCQAEHPALNPEHQNSCVFTLEPPFPEGQPMVTALEGTDKTLTCTEQHSLPPANIAWMKTARQEAIVPGSKYILSVEGPALKLTIVNVTKEDEGLYFCRSENPLAVRELEVYLTVKTSAPYSGAIIGIFLAALIVGAGAIIAKTLYSRRDRVCLGSSIFGQVVDDGGDVLSLVESDEEEIFQGRVPRLPPPSLTNGNHTTLVQIHRMPSSEIEDTDVPETRLQRQEDSVRSRTEESVDLVTF